MNTQTAGQTASKPALSPVLQKELDLIKGTFKENEDLLKQIRALFLGVPLLADEKKHIKDVFSDPELLALMQRRFLPDIKNSRDLPLGQIQDIWLNAEQMVFGAPAQQIEQASRYKERAVEYTKHALELLQNPDALAVQYTVSSYEEDPLQINLMARNMFLRHVDQQLMMLNMIANQKEESPKERADRTHLDSSK